MPKKARRKVLMVLHHLGDRAIPFVRCLEKAGLEVIHNPLDRWPTEDELIAVLPGVFATIAGGEPYTDRVFRNAKDLQIVARYGVGYDKIDVAAATRHGVMIAMAFGTNHEAVADSAFTLMAALVQKTVMHHVRVKEGGWGMDIHPGLWRMTVGIIGLGRIGKAMARRCPGFEMRVLAYDIRPDIVFATIAGGEPYTDRVFRNAKDLQIVARYGVGYDKIDVAAATRHGVMIAMAFGTNHEAVADSAFTLMAA
ncbi:MAG TPA: NAD(P)-dependent oxidoreductase, partial [Candidatus Acidoferrum sp.]|nr:NAD(P)-dependent oxidoreductase [Candidatus Acidoferrum sp.]